MNSVTGVYWKVLLVLIVISAFVLLGSFLGRTVWLLATVPLAVGMLVHLGQMIGVRKGWLIRCEGRLNCYRPKSMLLTVIAWGVIVTGGIALISVVLYILA